MKFIYVMDKASMKALKKKGCVLLKADEQNSIWIFENREEITFDLGSEYKYVMSDVMTF